MHQHLHRYNQNYALGITLNAAFVVVGVWYGLHAHSLALVSDAVHNASDVLALILSWAGTKLTLEFSHHRGAQYAAILSIVNALILIAVTVGIGFESFVRLAHPGVVSADTVAWVALIGIGVNATAAYLFRKGRHHDINMRGAFLHMVSDTCFAAAVVASALVIQTTGWYWVDPALSCAISVLLFLSSVGLLKDSLVALKKSA